MVSDEARRSDGSGGPGKKLQSTTGENCGDAEECRSTRRCQSYKTLPESDPDRAAAMADERKAKGNAAFLAGCFEEAALTVAIALAPNNHILYSNRSAARASLHRYADALADAQKTIELRPDWAEGYSRLGTAHLGLGAATIAVAAYAKGLALEPDNEGLKVGLEDAKKERKEMKAAAQEAGNAAYKKDCETAIQHYMKAMELDDEDISYLTNRAAVDFETGKYDECIKDCDKAVERGRELRADFKVISRELTRKGTALAKHAKCSKDYDVAIETFQKALREHRNPDTLKKLNEAERAKKELLQQEYYDPKLLAEEEREKGTEFFKEQKYPESIKHYTEALRRNPKDPRGFDDKGSVYYSENHRKASYEGARDKRKDISEGSAQEECKYYSTPGGCKFGKACKYLHREGKEGKAEAEKVDLNFLDLPLRPGKKECPYYMRTGSCKYSTNCKFHHPDPTNVSSKEPVLEHENADTPQQNFQGSSQTSVPIWSDQRAMNGQHVPFLAPAQSYSAGMIPLQGMYPSPEWSGYHQVPLNPNYPPGVPFQHFLAHMNHPMHKEADMPRNQQVPIDEYPERPGQPECQHFVRSSFCKYKMKCRYHHPRSRLPAPMTGGLSPLGLPIKPDQPVCTYYSRFGVCKYGPACMFNHPFNFGPPVAVPTAAPPLPGQYPTRGGATGGAARAAAPPWP